MDFNTILDRIKKQELILPDFQRGFVWDSEKMKKLYASVLAKIPVGSILTLESKDDNFNCKQIGAKPRCRTIEKPSHSVNYLIDGQQRLTSLLAGFSTYYFENYSDEKEIASNNLLSLYFIKLPAIDNVESDDIFGIRELSFKKRNFSSSEISELIESKYLFEIDQKCSKSKKKSFSLSDSSVHDAIYNYCTSSNSDETKRNFYRIPIQFIYGEDEDIALTRAKIIDQVANHYKKEGEETKKDVWKNSITSFFTNCLSQIELNEIEVKDSDKSRAIDIYNNLNQGGVKLGILDLIIATVGTEKNENFYDLIIKEFEKKIYFSKDVLPTGMRILIENYPEYSPADMGNIFNQDGTLRKIVENVFLDVLALLINKNKGKKFKKSLKEIDVAEKNKYFTSIVTKEDEILKLNAKEILDNYKLVCESILRAVLFFQTRCGIREFSSINYMAQITVIAYFFSDQTLFDNKKIHDLFEYWYWISVFAWMYPSNQKIEILNSIEEFETFIEGKLSIDCFKYIKNYKDDVFAKRFYSDKETLTMIKVNETEKYPPKSMTNYICQYYLSREIGYSSFFVDEKHKKTKKDEINVFYDEKLDIHHLMPLGSDPKKKIGQTTKELRTNQKNPFNSPLNMLLITKNDNLLISDMDYGKYSKDDAIKATLPKVGCIIGAKDLNEFLSNRFDILESSVKSTLHELELSLQNGVNA